MLDLKKRYLELKAKAKQLMLEGKTTQYISLLAEVEQLNLILVSARK